METTFNQESMMEEELRPDLTEGFLLAMTQKGGSFLLFSGNQSLPQGGWHDYKGEFSSVDSALIFLKSDIEMWDREWFHIVDLSTMSIKLHFRASGEQG